MRADLDRATLLRVTKLSQLRRFVSGALSHVMSAVEITDGLDGMIAYRGLQTGFERLGFTWNNTFLENYDVIVRSNVRIEAVPDRSRPFCCVRPRFDRLAGCDRRHSVCPGARLKGPLDRETEMQDAGAAAATSGQEGDERWNGC